MKRVLRSLAIYMIVASMLIVVDTVSYAESSKQTIDVTFNGVKLEFDGNLVSTIGQSYTLSNGELTPFSILYKGTTYLPIRKVSDLFSMEIGWKGDTSTITLSNKSSENKTEDSLQDDSTLQEETFSVNQSIEVAFNSINLKFDGNSVSKIGESYTLYNGETVPFSILYKGTTYLPIRKVSELFDKEVGWNNDTNTVTLGVKSSEEDNDKVVIMTAQAWMSEEASNELFGQNKDDSSTYPVEYLATTGNISVANAGNAIKWNYGGVIPDKYSLTDKPILLSGERFQIRYNYLSKEGDNDLGLGVICINDTEDNVTLYIHDMTINGVLLPELNAFYDDIISLKGYKLAQKIFIDGVDLDNAGIDYSSILEVKFRFEVFDKRFDESYMTDYITISES